jgi:hypothetical protein
MFYILIMVYICVKVHLIVYFKLPFFFLDALGFELKIPRLVGSSTTRLALFCDGFFKIGSQAICPNWLRTEILLISAS